MEASNAKANIQLCKDQMQVIKKFMDVNKGREGDTTLKAKVLKYQSKLGAISPNEKEHRLLNVYVGSYFQKLNLRNTDDKQDSGAPDLMTVDFPELMRQKALKAESTQTDPIKLVIKMKKQQQLIIKERIASYSKVILLLAVKISFLIN